MTKTSSAMKFIRALSVIFHPIIHLFSRRDPHHETSMTAIYLHRQVLLRFLTICFGKCPNTVGRSTVSAIYRRSDDGQLARIQFFIHAMNTIEKGKFDRIALHVRFRDAVTDKPITIVSYSSPASSRETAVIPEGMDSELLIPGDLFTYGLRDDVVRWDWQHNPDSSDYFGLSEGYFVEISIPTARWVMAEFRLVSHFHRNGKVEKRSIPQKEGTFVKQLLMLAEDDLSALAMTTE